MAYDPENDRDRPVAAYGRGEPMPDPDSYSANGEARFRDEGDEPRVKAMPSRVKAMAPDTEEQLEDWQRSLTDQYGQLQAEHSEIEDQLSAILYRKATLEARITTVHQTARSVDQILQEHRRHMGQASEALEKRGHR